MEQAQQEFVDKMTPVIARKGKKRLRDWNEQEWNDAYK